MKDKVSIVLAVYNEQAIIWEAIQSLLQQKSNGFEVEILVVDGNSDDGTKDLLKEIEAQSAGRVKYLFNQARITPVAFNLGIKAASGNYIAIFGAHAEYANDYLEVCLDEMQRTGAAGCSGVVIPKMKEMNRESELCLRILSSPIGVSGRSFRTRESGFAESIPYGVFRKDVFEKVGFYNERLIRNQDNDMNYRINKAGYQLYITGKTHAYYYPKSDLRELKRYAFKSGFWNAKSLKLGSYTLRFLHFVPFFFLLFNILLLGMLILTLVADDFYLLIPLLAIYIFYWALVFIESRKQKFEFGINRWAFPWAVYVFHLNYGLGTLKGFFSKG